MASELNSYDYLKKHVGKLLELKWDNGGKYSHYAGIVVNDYCIVLDISIQNRESSFESVKVKLLTKHGISEFTVAVTNSTWFLRCWAEDEFGVVE